MTAQPPPPPPAPPPPTKRSVWERVRGLTARSRRILIILAVVGIFLGAVVVRGYTRQSEFNACLASQSVYYDAYYELVPARDAAMLERWPWFDLDTNKLFGQLQLLPPGGLDEYTGIFDEFLQQVGRRIDQTCYDRVCRQGTSFDVLGKGVHALFNAELSRCP